MNLLEDYLRELHEIRSSGSAVKETSYYPALSNLLNGIGKTLKPRVRCVINIKNRGAGLPDGGFFPPISSSVLPALRFPKERIPPVVSWRLREQARTPGLSPMASR
jgi:hypothetical protein